MARRTLTAILALVVAAALATPAAAQLRTEYEWTADRPDGVSPIGLVGDRTYAPGTFDFSYRFTAMSFDGSRIGTSPVSVAQVLDLFFAAPVRAKMTMHLFGVTYTPMDKLTVEASVPFLVYEGMDNVTGAGQQYSYTAGIWQDTDRHAFGDVKLLGHLPVYDEGPYRAHLTGGVSVPLGSFYQRSRVPFTSPPTRQRNPYPVQIGSGTWDLMPGFTLLAMNETGSTGIQGNAVLRLHENELNYRLGHRFEGSVWGAFRLTDYISTSFRIHTLYMGDVAGADPSLNPNIHPAANPALQGGTRVALPLGLNVYFPEGFLEGHRLGFEAALPIYQDLNGPQLEHDWTMTIGWEYLLER